MTERVLLGFLDTSVRDSQSAAEAAMKTAASTGETVDFLAAQQKISDTQIRTTMYSGVMKSLHDLVMKIVSNIN
jgi:hypothetical protein